MQVFGRFQNKIPTPCRPTSAKERAQPADISLPQSPRHWSSESEMSGVSSRSSCALLWCRGEWMRGPLATGLNTSRRGHRVCTHKNFSVESIYWDYSPPIMAEHKNKHRLDNTSMWASTGGKLPRRAATATRAFRPTSASFDIQVRALRLELQPPEGGPGILSFCQPSRSATRGPLPVSYTCGYRKGDALGAARSPRCSGPKAVSYKGGNAH